MDIWKELKQEGVDSGLLEEVRAFRDAHPAPPEAAGRVPRPRFLYYGKEVWEGAAAALLKARSPSCGIGRVYDRSEERR